MAKFSPAGFLLLGNGFVNLDGPYDFGKKEPIEEDPVSTAQMEIGLVIFGAIMVAAICFILFMYMFSHINSF
jgi:hypothetical protein